MAAREATEAIGEDAADVVEEEAVAEEVVEASSNKAQKTARNLIYQRKSSRGTQLQNSPERQMTRCMELFYGLAFWCLLPFNGG